MSCLGRNPSGNSANTVPRLPSSSDEAGWLRAVRGEPGNPLSSAALSLATRRPTPRRPRERPTPATESVPLWGHTRGYLGRCKSLLRIFLTRLHPLTEIRLTGELGQQPIDRSFNEGGGWVERDGWRMFGNRFGRLFLELTRGIPERVIIFERGEGGFYQWNREQWYHSSRAEDNRDTGCDRVESNGHVSFFHRGVCLY